MLSKTLEQFRDEGFIKLKEIEISENNELTRKMNIIAVPALIFFKDGKLLKKNIELYGETLVNKGVMIGFFNELILKEIIEQI